MAFGPQTESMEKNIRSLPKGKRNSFFSLFEKEKSSIYARLDKSGISFAYGEYFLGSMIIHGSSMQEFISINRPNIWPKLLLMESDIAGYFDRICSGCYRIFVVLEIVNMVVFEKKRLEDKVGK